jgi:predicted amidophosphoribosyltransferase
MSIALFFLLALIVAGLIAYPLLPGRAPKESAPVVTDADIDRAVRDLRRSRTKKGSSCPACGKSYQAGDRFCVRCGRVLPEAQAAGPSDPVCPSCGASIHAGDQFCAKCGHHMGSREAS